MRILSQITAILLSIFISVDIINNKRYKKINILIPIIIMIYQCSYCINIKNLNFINIIGVISALLPIILLFKYY